MPQLDQGTFLIQSCMISISLVLSYAVVVWLILPEATLALQLRGDLLRSLQKDLLHCLFIFKQYRFLYKMNVLLYFLYLGDILVFLKKQIRLINFLNIFVLEELFFSKLLKKFSLKMFFLTKFIDNNSNLIK